MDRKAISDLRQRIFWLREDREKFVNYKVKETHPYNPKLTHSA